jgi:hypothetical protein
LEDCGWSNVPTAVVLVSSGLHGALLGSHHERRMVGVAALYLSRFGGGTMNEENKANYGAIYCVGKKPRRHSSERPIADTT